MHEELPQSIEPPEQDRPPVTPRIYAASLSDYNAGRLHGAWIDADQPVEDLAQALAAMLATSPIPGAEEWAIHDADGFLGLRLSEYEPLETISRLAAGIAARGEAFAALAEVLGTDRATEEAFDVAYRGSWDSVTAYAEELLDDLGLPALIEAAVPPSLQPYVRIDAEAFARDLEIGGDIYVAQAGAGGVHIFGSDA